MAEYVKCDMCGVTVDRALIEMSSPLNYVKAAWEWVLDRNLCPACSDMVKAFIDKEAADADADAS